MADVFQGGAVPGEVLLDVADPGRQQAIIHRRLIAGDTDGVVEGVVQFVGHRLEQRILQAFLNAIVLAAAGGRSSPR